jgi:hypothetical protein
MTEGERYKKRHKTRKTDVKYTELGRHTGARRKYIFAESFEKISLFSHFEKNNYYKNKKTSFFQH